MANQKISELPELDISLPADLLTVVQSGNNYKISKENFSKDLVGLVKVKYVELSNDDIKSLVGTPYTLLSPAGSGFIWQPISACMILDNSAGAYGNLTSPAILRIQTENGYQIFNPLLLDSDRNITSLLDFLADVAGVHNVIMAPGESQGGYPVASQSVDIGARERHGFSIIDQGINLSLYNGGEGELTDGHADNKLKLIMLYMRVLVVED